MDRSLLDIIIIISQLSQIPSIGREGGALHQNGIGIELATFSKAA
jgi:hypothetical protein